MHPQTFTLSDPVGPRDNTLGPRAAVVTLVEYGDFECPHCKQAAGAMRLMLAPFEGKARFAFRHFPLKELHPHAMHAAQAAECAGAQGKFWQMHDLLFENQRHLKPAQLVALARSLGLDMARYTAEMDDEIYLQRVRKHQAGGNSCGARATPTFFVNGRLQEVSYGLHILLERVEAELLRQDRATA